MTGSASQTCCQVRAASDPISHATIADTCSPDAVFSRLIPADSIELTMIPAKIRCVVSNMPRRVAMFKTISSVANAPINAQTGTGSRWRAPAWPAAPR